MYVKDGDHPRHNKGSYKKRDGSRKKAIYRRSYALFWNSKRRETTPFEPL